MTNTELAKLAGMRAEMVEILCAGMTEMEKEAFVGTMIRGAGKALTGAGRAASKAVGTQVGKFKTWRAAAPHRAIAKANRNTRWEGHVMRGMRRGGNAEGAQAYGKAQRAKRLAKQRAKNAPNLQPKPEGALPKNPTARAGAPAAPQASSGSVTTATGGGALDQAKGQLQKGWDYLKNLSPEQKRNLAVAGAAGVGAGAIVG